MQSMINKDFENLAQRGIYYFIATYSSFILLMIRQRQTLMNKKLLMSL